MQLLSTFENVLFLILQGSALIAILSVTKLCWLVLVIVNAVIVVVLPCSSTTVLAHHAEFTLDPTPSNVSDYSGTPYVFGIDPVSQ